MKCPACDVTLVLAERQGIEIDYCPECRGVWLDRGELDKIIERSNAISNRKKSDYDYDEDNRDNRRTDAPVFGQQDENYYKRHKKKSLLGDLFDF